MSKEQRDRVSTGDVAALIAATDSEGRPDPVRFHAHRLYHRHPSIDGVDADGLTRELLSMKSSGADDVPLRETVQAIFEILEPHQAEHVQRHLQAAGLWEVAPAPQPRPRIWFWQRRGARLHKQTMARLARSVESASPGGWQRFKKVLLTAAEEQLRALQEHVDLDAFRRLFAVDPHYRNMVVGYALLLVEEQEEADRQECARSVFGGLALKEWQKDFKSAHEETDPVLPDEAGVVGAELLAIAFPRAGLHKLGKLFRMQWGGGVDFSDPIVVEMVGKALKARSANPLS